jgi:hypothetical protein
MKSIKIEKELLIKIQKCKTMPELDDLRGSIVLAGYEDKEVFYTLQKAFIKQKNKLKRIPLMDRNW